MRAKIIILAILISTFVPRLCSAQATAQSIIVLDTIYANDTKNVALFFPEPIRQGITGSDNFVFTYNREKEQYFGLHQATPGKESNLLVVNRNGSIFSYIVRYKKQLSKLNYFIPLSNSIGNEKPIVKDSVLVESSEELAKELLGSRYSINKKNNGTLVASNKAYVLNFDQRKESTVFNVEIKKSGKYTFFTEHMPFEFEADEHFFKDASNNDVEPIAQVPDEGGGHHHHHHHGHGSLDPHVWHDPANIIKMSKVISKNLKKDISIFNRKDRKSINERIDSTESILSGLNGWIVDQVSTIPEQDRVLVSKHKAMDYYGAAFGFETVSLLDFLGDSSSLRPENISSTLNMLEEENVKAIFPEQIPASKLLKNLSRQSSVPLASNQIFVDGLMMDGNTVSVAVHNTCTIVDSLGGSCDKESGSNLESEWYKLSD